MVDQAINFGQEIQNFSDITLKVKQYEGLKLLVVEEKDVLAVLPPLNALIQDQILTMRKGTLNVCF